MGVFELAIRSERQHPFNNLHGTSAIDQKAATHSVNHGTTALEATPPMQATRGCWNGTAVVGLA